MKVKLLSIAILASTIFMACGETEKPLDNPNNQKALAEIKKEPKIKEALLSEYNILYVSVEDDGTNRNGYAQYLCEVLAEHKATTKGVKVMEVGTAGKPGVEHAYGVLLGEAICK